MDQERASTNRHRVDSVMILRDIVIVLDNTSLNLREEHQGFSEHFYHSFDQWLNCWTLKETALVAHRGCLENGGWLHCQFRVGQKALWCAHGCFHPQSCFGKLWFSVWWIAFSIPPSKSLTIETMEIELHAIGPSQAGTSFNLSSILRPVQCVIGYTPQMISHDLTWM